MAENPSTNSSAPKSNVVAGVDRSHGGSPAPKLAFFLIHTLSLGLCAWIVVGGGLATIGRWFGANWSVTDQTRALLVLGATALYWARHGVTLFYLLVRRVTWSEAMGLASFILLVEVGLCVLATGVSRSAAAPIGVLDFVALGLVAVGSFFNTGSEVMRKRWKAHPENKGHCYTRGLFALSMHINYFGDSLLFTGWSILSAVWWTLALPALMTALFVFMHIPGLDRYLDQRYGDEFREYARHTKKFVPFLY